MDFFGQQQAARQRTGLLLLLFCLAVLAIILAINVLFIVTFGVDTEQPFLSQLFSAESLSIGAVVALVISLVVVIKWLMLKGGGGRIAESMGGVRVQTNTQDRQQRQLLNVVEEIALAAGIKVPPVYVLSHEPGINAFAAGHSPDDAVIGVTQGTLDQLSRSQLQGVIAHEFSHILNGDMRLNLRLMAVLAGILFISHAGEFVMHASRGNRKASAQVALFGIALMILGAIGAFFGKLIKAAVNRQREYLADAAAVQFTRDPQTIVGALKMIAANQFGSNISHSGASQASHLLFSGYTAFAGMFDTHPPLEKRIRAIDPSWDGKYADTVIKTKQQQTQKKPRPDPNYQATPKPAAALPGNLNTLVREPAASLPLAIAAVFGSTETQAAAINTAGSVVELAQLQLTSSLSFEHKTQLLQQLHPTLSELSAQQQQQLLAKIEGQTEHDLPQWCLAQLIRHSINPKSKAKLKAKISSKVATTELLALLAAHGNEDLQQQQRAFYRGCNAMGWYQAKYPEQVSWANAQQDVAKLRLIAPKDKQRLIRAFSLCAEHDGIINQNEQDLLHCLELLLEAPPQYQRQ